MAPRAATPATAAQVEAEVDAGAGRASDAPLKEWTLSTGPAELADGNATKADMAIKAKPSKNKAKLQPTRSQT